jgi:hypothetical protein
MWTPDSRVCVWFVETETFHFYDVGAGQCLIAQFWDAVDPRLLAVHCMKLMGEAAVTPGGSGDDSADSDDAHHEHMVLGSSIQNSPCIFICHRRFYSLLLLTKG